MFLSMSPSAKVLHHFLMHDNPEAQAAIVSTENAQRLLLPAVTYSGEGHGRENCHKKIPCSRWAKTSPK